MQEADHILIPLLDGTHGLAQVARTTQTRALIHITAERATPSSKTKPIPDTAVLATVLVDTTSLVPLHWPAIGYDALPSGRTTDPADLEGDAPLDPAIVEAFVNAIQGLYPWDGFPDPRYFANLLHSPDTPPQNARLQSDFPQPDPA